MSDRSIEWLCSLCALMLGAWLGMSLTVFFLGDSGPVLQMARLGTVAQALSAVIAIASVVLVVYQIQRSTKILAEDRTCDAVRLVTDWLETEDARKIRGSVFFRDKVKNAVEGEVLVENVGGILASLEEHGYRRSVEEACAQLERVGQYLQTLRPEAQNAVVGIYAPAIVRSWAILAPHLRIMR